ncbi:MAG: hypothetical protein LBT86_08815 [Deltaproteobacteria bacterium]|jgi:hypothetical protein|nr:hypothetical protein [Deltaproteobacteria bacterium]
MKLTVDFEPEQPRFDFKDRQRMRLGFRLVTRQGDEYDFPHGLFTPNITPPPPEILNQDDPSALERSWKSGLEDAHAIFQHRSIIMGSLNVSVQYLEGLLKEAVRHRKVTKSDFYQKAWKEMTVEDFRLLFILEKKHSPFLAEFADAAIFLLKDFGEPLEAINLNPPYWTYLRKDNTMYFTPTNCRVVTVAEDGRKISEKERLRLENRPLLKKFVDLTLVK